MACTNFDIGLHRIDAESVLRGTVLKFRKAEPLSTTDFVQHFFTNLKGTNLFNLESEAEYVSLSKVFEDYIKTSRKGRGKPLSRRQRAEIWDFAEKFKK